MANSDDYKRVTFKLKDGDIISIKQNKDKTIEIRLNGFDVNKTSIRDHEIDNIEFDK